MNTRGPSSEERATVLVVDDDRAFREAVAELLGGAYDLLLAGSAQQALELFREHRPDLVLLDVGLPEQDGLVVFHQLQADARFHGAPVVFVSGDDDEETMVRALEMGGADYLVKPVGGKVLRARLDRALREAREKQALSALAQTDALTGLSNFRALSTRVQEEFKRAARYHYALAAVMIDLDHLKVINDRFGHEAGNRAITALSRHLKSNLREVDFAARFGGDEFVVLLPHQTAHEAAIFAERVRAGLGSISTRDSEGTLLQINLTISVGISAHQPSSPKRSADHLMDVADSALYAAKRRGRDRCVVFEGEDDQAMGERQSH